MKFSFTLFAVYFRKCVYTENYDKYLLPFMLNRGKFAYLLYSMFNLEKDKTKIIKRKE